VISPEGRTRACAAPSSRSFFRGLADGVLPLAQTNALIEKCWSVATLADVAEIARMAVPNPLSVPI